MRKQLKDFEKKEYYASRERRAKRTGIKWGLGLFIFFAIITIIVLYFLHTVSCVQASGRTRYICEHDRCCETLPAHNPNQGWLQ